MTTMHANYSLAMTLQIAVTLELGHNIITLIVSKIIHFKVILQLLCIVTW